MIRPKKLLNQKGMAMIVATFAMVIAIVVATEVAYESQVDFVDSSHSIHRVKAYYAAKAGAELSLYRVLLYKKSMAQYGEQLKDNKSLLDMIWQMPFAWPPTLFESINAVDRDQIDTVMKDSFMEAQFVTNIQAEGGKIDINDLGSESKALADGVKKQILQIFANKLESDKNFKDKYQNYNFEELVGYIKDWVDEDNVGDKGDESLQYDQPQDVKNFKLPPNAPFKTVAELHMVKNMQDDFFKLLENSITVHGSKGINVNYCSAEILKSMDPQINEEVVGKILKRRDNPEEGGPFADDKDFYSYLEAQNVRTEQLQKAKLPLLFDAEYNFRIVSTGQSGNVKREITAITFDVDNLTSRYVEILDNARAERSGGATGARGSTGGTGATGGTGPAGGNAKKKVKIPKGRPTIVFWQET